MTGRIELLFKLNCPSRFFLKKKKTFQFFNPTKLNCRYDDDDSGFLDYKEFTRGLFGLESNSKADPVARGAVERMRDRVLQRGGRNGIRTLGKLFQR